MPAPPHLHLVLYVAGDSLRSVGAATALRRLLDGVEGDAYTLDIVDVLEQPEDAERDRIVATPTIVRLHPSPRLQVVGDPSQPSELAHLRTLLFTDHALARNDHGGAP